MNAVTIQGKRYGVCKSAKCRYTDKQSRAAKLAYRFDELWEKFDGMVERGQGLTVNARLALACKMMMACGIRIGNEGSAEGYMTKPHPYSKKEPEFVQTYGLTTIEKRHVMFKRGKAYLSFVGKKQVENSFELSGELARQIKTLYDNTGEEETLFGVSVYELTKFVKKSVGRQFTPKDFRTMRANLYAFEKFAELCKMPLPKRKSEQRAEIKSICEYVSERLNNTPGVCKTSYIDADLWAEYYENRIINK